CRRRRWRCTGNAHVVNTPPLRLCAVVVTAHSPPQDDVVPSHSRRQFYGRRNKAPRIPGPCLSGKKRVSVAGYKVGVTAGLKDAAGVLNVLKAISAVSAELQHATVVAGFEIKIIVEDQRGGEPRDVEGWRVQPLVALKKGTINPRGVGA